jgi:hypothetical protein
LLSFNTFIKILFRAFLIFYFIPPKDSYFALQGLAFYKAEINSSLFLRQRQPTLALQVSVPCIVNPTGVAKQEGRGEAYFLIKIRTKQKARILFIFILFCLYKIILY